MLICVFLSFKYCEKYYLPSSKTFQLFIPFSSTECIVYCQICPVHNQSVKILKAHRQLSNIFYVNPQLCIPVSSRFPVPKWSLPASHFLAGIFCSVFALVNDLDLLDATAVLSLQGVPVRCFSSLIRFILPDWSTREHPF